MTALDTIISLRFPYLFVDPTKSGVEVRADTTRMMAVYSEALLVMTLLILALFRNRKRSRKITKEDESAVGTIKAQSYHLTQSNGYPEKSMNPRSTGLTRELTGLNKSNRGRVSFWDQLRVVTKDPAFMCYVVSIFFVAGCILAFMSNYVGMVSSFGISEVRASKNHFLHKFEK